MHLGKNMEENKEKFTTKLARFHDKYYKLLLLIPAIILLFSIAYMAVFYSNTGDFANRDISLTGGTSITIQEKRNIEDVERDLSGKLESLNIREIYDLITREQKALIIETTSDVETTRDVLEDYFGYSLTEENSSIEFTGSSLSESFFRQLLIAILLAFLFMAIVVFITFRTFVPSTAILISAFADIFMTLTLFNILGFKLSIAGIVAFLMLIRYSVDTDILLTNRVLKRHEDSLNKRIFSAFKTGITMTLTSLIAIIFALLIVRSFSVVLTQIFTILVIGLSFDIFNTWITNASLIKWYAKKKNEA
jgi:preprotein translocase subunit SecF